MDSPQDQQTDQRPTPCGPMMRVRVNILVVGKSGIGKTAFQRTLFGRVKGVWSKDEYVLIETEDGKYTPAVEAILKRLSTGRSTKGFTLDIPPMVKVMKNGLQVHLKLFDSEGFGEAAHLEENWENTMNFIDQQRMRHEPIHAVLYLLEPFRLTGADIDYMKLLAENVNVIPLIAKADSMDPQQKEAWRGELHKLLQTEKIHFFQLHPEKVLCVAGSEHGEMRYYSSQHKFNITHEEVSDIVPFEDQFYSRLYDIRDETKKFNRAWKDSNTWQNIVKTKATAFVFSQNMKYVLWLLLALFFVFLGYQIAAFQLIGRW